MSPVRAKNSRDTSPTYGLRPLWGTPRTWERLTLGDKVGTIARMLGKPLMPHQQYVMDVALEIDPDTGKLAYNDITVLMGRQQGKTTMVIAHNFAAMEKFDLILVLKNNRVLEQGTHDRLLEQKGRYYRLYQRQIRSEYCP